MTFQRARSEEQREIRRRAILDAAVAMLGEMPVAAISLNELSRRIGLAKSNVLRYFETREAVLLELLNDFLREWLDALTVSLDGAVGPQLPAGERAALLAATIARSLADRPALCGLFGAQGGVLEQNVSVEVLARHKRESNAILAESTALIRKHVPEIGEAAQAYCLQVLLVAGAASAYIPPPPSVLAVYRADPSLAIVSTDLHETLHLAVTMMTTGVLPRA